MTEEQQYTPSIEELRAAYGFTRAQMSGPGPYSVEFDCAIAALVASVLIDVITVATAWVAALDREREAGA
jgi:hypothetical protein